MSTSPRIERGAALLDQACPAWENDIDLGTLDLGNECDCVLGQLYGDYATGLAQVDGPLTWHNAGRFGFITYGRESYEALTQKWRRFIRGRRTT
jgi:hypothetical protein